MNQSLDILFLRKKVTGAKLKLNLKPKYFKTLKKPSIFYNIAEFLQEDDLFELNFTCRKFKNMIKEDTKIDNKVLRASIRKLKKKVKNEEEPQQVDREKKFNPTSNEEVIKAQKLMLLKSRSIKMNLEKQEKIKKIEQIVAQAPVEILSKEPTQLNGSGTKSTLVPIENQNYAEIMKSIDSKNVYMYKNEEEFRKNMQSRLQVIEERFKTNSFEFQIHRLIYKANNVDLNMYNKIKDAGVNLINLMKDTAQMCYNPDEYITRKLVSIAHEKKFKSITK